MLILNKEKKESIDSIVILLNKNELKELSSALDDKEVCFEHYHLCNDDYTKEVNLVLYDLSDLSKFDEETKKLLQEEGK